ncbi:hypothetical protein Rhopal_004853-T1 [Rhodotorula paludigena]|uniref:WD40 repeat-like protein n=1 Tax=Rhodotorula paludigena TaxID=86838 RepID=A0AAV5GQP0_9BASI|nr:hypothetical protein Rhopal_004853-T1 [Rhodotorula paludigena]
MHTVEADPPYGPAAAAPAASLDSGKIGGHGTSRRLPSIIIDDSTDASYDSSSSSESLHPLSRASGSDAPATPPPATASNGAPYSSAAFRSPTRHVRAKSAAPIGVSPPKTPRATVDFSAVSPDYPLPHPPFQFDVLNHAPARDPMAPPGWKAPKERTVDENIEEMRRAKERLRRAEEQRRTREPFAGSAELVWEQAAIPRTYLEYVMPGESNKPTTYRSTAFFPYSHLPGLGYLKDLFAVVGGHKLTPTARLQIDVLQLEHASTSQSSPARLVKRTLAPEKFEDKKRVDEEFFTCAWSVDISTQPYTPILAVAGRGRSIEIYHVAVNGLENTLQLQHNRSIAGHGGSIFHLCFHPSYPHLLASCSEDKTIRLWDATVPWGADAAVWERLGAVGQNGKRGHARPPGGRSTQAQSVLRPMVPGELLGVLSEAGHEKGALSCDFHATLPLLATSGMDGFIKIWHLPSSVLSATPYWPTTPVYRRTSSQGHQPHDMPVAIPPSPSPMPPPIFSSYALHPGQWPDQVLFASPTTCTVLSKAPVSHPTSRFSPRTSVKVWVPTALDVLPSSQRAAHEREMERSRGEVQAKDAATSGRAPLEVLATCPPLPSGARSESSFRVLYEAVLEGQSCVGDRMGWYRPSSSSASSSAREREEPYFVLPTATPLPSPGGRSALDPALYFFHPFAPLSLPHSLAPNASQADKIAAARDALFPPERDRTMHDFHPRLRPTQVVDVERVEAKARDGVHFRAVGVQGEPGGAVVAVGDGGRIVVLRRRRKGR